MKQIYSTKIRQLTQDVHVTRLFIIMIAWMSFMAIFKFGRFYTVRNFQTMFSQFPEYGLMALGIMLCMIIGGIDLSVVGIANLTAIISAMVMKGAMSADATITGGVFFLVVIMGVLIGGCAGALNGFLISVGRIPPILATLGTMELFSGIGIILTQGKAISGLPVNFTDIIAGKAFGFIPNQFIIFSIAVCCITFLLKYTPYGKKIFLVGSNITAARFSGLKTKRIILLTHMTSGILASVAGLIMLANYNSARADYGVVYTLQCVLIVVLGGVNPAGGSGKIKGVLLAILVLQMLSSGLNRFPQISSFYTPLIWGAVLIIVMVMNYYTDVKKG